MNLTDLRTKTIADIINREGGYSNDPNDSGGETMYGVTAAVARSYGYTGRMAHLPRSVAENVYRDKYWNALRLDDVGSLSFSVAEELADTGVNSGIYRAGEFFQRSLNILNRGGSMYPDLKVDGDIGSKTVENFRSYLGRRGSEGENVMVKMLNCLQGAFMVELAERREKDEEFIYGWILNRVVVPNA